MTAFHPVLPATACPMELGKHIADNNQAYLDFPRAEGDARAVLGAKLAKSHWRARVLERLLNAAEQESARGRLDPIQLVSNLAALNLYLDNRQRQRLAAVLQDRSLLGAVFANQGLRLPDAPEHHLLAGPDMDLKIKVNRASAWPFSKWQQIDGFAEYAFEGNRVRYRGLELQPGDILLANVNLDGNSVYTSLSEPKGYCPHAAVFAVLSADGKRFPAVVETYEKGLRAVPLNVFLNARYVAYAEVYRHRDILPEHGDEVSAAAHDAIAQARGYNFYTCDPDPLYVSCTSLAQVVYQRIGLPPIPALSRIGHPGIRDNLARLGYHEYEPFFAPVDFLLNPDFSCVGWVDNNQFPRLLARELVEVGFRRLFERGRLDTSRMPLMHHINHWGIGHMRRRSGLGRIISRIMGFDHLSLPRGPDPMLAIIAPVEADLGRAVRRLLPNVQRYLDGRETFALDAMLGESAIQDAIDRMVRLRWL
ncbi:MAG: hypothetical protein EA417_10410 [Gammaproteobacteria bacterium]|nr:MAG: hypothetical protein EA417_10410 [Gammaproteobacteria bacterium]